MIIIGICGRSGSGKSTVGKIISQKYPAYIDCDKVSKEVTTKGSDCLFELCSCFGDHILNEDGTLNRGKLASIAFSSKEKTEILNIITHKYITESIDQKIKRFNSLGEKFVFLDAPTLFESGINKKCDVILSLITDEELLVDRIISRDNKSLSEVRKRLSVQHSNEFLKTNSDICIYNNGTLAQLEDATKKALQTLEEKYGK